MSNHEIDLEIEAFLALPTSRKLLRAIKRGSESVTFKTYWEAMEPLGYNRKDHDRGEVNGAVPYKFYYHKLFQYVEETGGMPNGRKKKPRP